MSVWIDNLIINIEDRPVVILHGNVRDKYIDDDGRVYENLSKLIGTVAKKLPISFPELTVYDTVGNERVISAEDDKSSKQDENLDEVDEDEEFSDTSAKRNEDKQNKKTTPTRILAKWARLLSKTDKNSLCVLFYLDKLVSYKASYQEQENEILLHLEKLIENISPNNRLIMVALQDTMIPVELYTNSPKTSVLPISIPDKSDRTAYIEHRLGVDHDHLELLSNLTDGLFLRDLDNIFSDLSELDNPGTREISRLVNKYRIGKQEDQWGTLDIEKIDGAKDWFTEEEGVKGQTEALNKVVDMLCLARSGLTGIASGTMSKPKGVLFFAGPTGVGKTFVAKKLAKFLFSTEEAFLRFDMSEFKEDHTVSKLIGSPPGYVGSERGGMLSNSVREKPFSVILFDEIEKAHPKIMDIFLQILDEGRLTDSRGQTVFFTESVIIFTSNLGTRTTDSRGGNVNERVELDNILEDDNISEDESRELIRNHFSKSVESFFMYEISRPELLNRIGNNIVPFNFIHSNEVQIEIIGSHLKRIKSDFMDKYRSSNHEIEFSGEVAEWLTMKHGDSFRKMGGRGITNAISDEVMIKLASSVLRSEHENRQAVKFRVGISDEALVVEDT